MAESSSGRKVRLRAVGRCTSGTSAAVQAFLSAVGKRYELSQLCNSTGIVYHGRWFKVVSEHLRVSRYFQVTMAFVL